MSSPRTPRHSPHPSLDFSAASYMSYSPQQERRQSKASSFNDSSMDLGVAGSGLDGSSGVAGHGAGGGLGNLADELAGAFSDVDDYDDDNGYDEDGAYEDGGGDPDGDDRGSRNAPGINLEEDAAAAPAAVPADQRRTDGLRDSGVDVEDSPSRPGNRSRSSGNSSNSHHHHHQNNNNKQSLGLPPAQNGRGHRRAGSEYDGSEYGSESDLESPGMPPKLVDKMDEVEALARRGTENNGSAMDGAFKRVTEGLRDLGSQAGVEGGATRLITAHSALTTHLSHQTRQLHNLTFPLLSPLVAPPDPETIEALLPMLLTLSELMPRPATAALGSLAALHALTADLARALNQLADTLHVSRQATTTAARRLRAARELVAELRRDEELREQGERWLARGAWPDRLRRRECAHVCGEVVGGFEAVCDAWRERLLALASSSSPSSTTAATAAAATATAGE